MIITKAEKEKLVLELYEQGKTYRDIANQAHMSLGDISKIIKKHTGEYNKEANFMPLSKDTQALKLLSQNKTLLEVVTELGLSEAESDRIYKFFLKLKGLGERYNAYEEIMKNNTTTSLLEFYKIISEKEIGEKELQYILQYAYQLQSLDELIGLRTEKLYKSVKDIQDLYSKKKEVQEDIEKLKKGRKELVNHLQKLRSNYQNYRC